jgi:hypothetical protein
LEASFGRVREWMLLALARLQALQDAAIKQGILAVEDRREH